MRRTIPLLLLFFLVLTGCGTVKKARTGMARLMLGGVGQEIERLMLCAVPRARVGDDGSIWHEVSVPLNKIDGCGAGQEPLLCMPGVVPMDGKGRPKWEAGDEFFFTLADPSKVDSPLDPGLRKTIVERSELGLLLSVPNASAPPRIVRRATRDR